MAMPNRGSCMRISTLFCLSLRLLASAPDSITVWHPPARAARWGSWRSIGSVLPCTAAMMRMPLWDMVLIASTSATVLISSTMTMWGLWFSTASLILSCCRLMACPSFLKDSTGSQRALPMAGCGIVPSPPISHVLSTTTTMFFLSSERRLANSRRHVVFPLLGLPIRSSDSPLSNRSGTSASTTPSTVLPTRAVTPMTGGTPSAASLCERMTERRCSVPSMPMRRVARRELVCVCANILAKRAMSDCSQLTCASASLCSFPVPVSANTASGHLPSCR
mmetsp:Transcript_31540/g.79412  ORF Transcript_31540/g.79412 Transcript_31540/m.79412 type:complete len:278 (-) Transcript_31540:165-998(-)